MAQSRKKAAPRKRTGKGREAPRNSASREGIPAAPDVFRWLAQVAQTTRTGITVADAQGRIIYTNAAEARMHGYRVEELLGQSAAIFALPGTGKPIRASDLQKIQTWRRESLNVRKDGSVFPVQLISNVVTDAGGKPIGIVTISEDITERKEKEKALEQAKGELETRVAERTAELRRANDVLKEQVAERLRAEQELLESQRAYATLVSNLQGMAYRCRNDRDWTMEFASEGCLDLTGYPPADFIGNRKRSYNDLIHPEDQQKIWAEVQEALRENRPFQLQYRIRTASSRVKWVWEQGRAVPWAGKEVRLEGFITDITERWEAENQLKHANALLLAQQEASASGILVVDRHGVVTAYNQQFLRLWNIPTDVAGKKSDSLLLDYVKKRIKDWDGFIALVSYLYEHPEEERLGERIELQSGRVLSRNTKPVRLADGTIIGRAWDFTDITGRLRAETLLQGAARATAQLLTVQKYETSIQEAIATLGEAAGVDRVFLFEEKIEPIKGLVSFEPRFEWCGPGISSQIGNLSIQKISPHELGIPSWLPDYLAGKPIALRPDETPEPMRSALHAIGTKSLLFVPIPVTGSRWGFIGFENNHHEHSWSEQERSILRAMAASIGTAFERRRSEQALRYRIDFEQLIGTISTNFINLDPTELDEGIHHALQAIGEFAGASRSYVVLFEGDPPQHGNLTHAWCAVGVPPPPKDRQTDWALRFKWLSSRLLRLETAIVPDASKLPAEAGAERAMLEGSGTHSIVAVPMVIGGTLVGFLGFDSVSGPREWTDDEISLLRITGQVFANALQRKWIGEKDHLEEHRFRENQSALIELTKRDWSVDPDPVASLQQITEASGRALGVSRASIWLYNPGRTKIVCADLYEMATGTHSRGGELLANDYPSYFEAIERDRVVNADNVESDPRTRQLSKSYSRPLGIGSLLDAPVRLEGRTVGVVCHEIVGSLRKWTTEEQNFAGSVADIVALALEQWERSRAERLLLGTARATDELLRNPDLHGAIEAVVKILGEAADADRVYLFERHPHPSTGEEVYSNTYEWCREGIPPQIHNPLLHNLSPKIVEGTDIYKRLLQGEAFGGLVRDLPDTLRLLQEAQGVLSMIIVPAFVFGEAWGFLGFDACRTERVWTESEESLLHALAGSLGAAAERRHAEEALREMAQGVSLGTSEGFFQSLLIHLAKALHAEHAYIGKLSGGDRIETIAVCAHGQPAENFSYDLAGTPCAQVVRGRPCCFKSGIQNLFPRDTMLADLGIESYLGAPLIDSSGNVLGLLTALSREPLQDTRRHETMLQIFATRAAGELERQRAEAERAALERKFLEAQKLESLGLLAGGIAHDFNNLLMAMLGNAGLALTEMPEEASGREAVRRIETAAKRAADLTRQLLAYSGKGRFVVGPVNLNSVIEEMGQLLRVSIPKDTILRYNLGTDLPSVEADGSQIHQIVMNLIVNASEAIGESEGAIVLSTGVMDLRRADFADAFPAGDLAEGRYVFLEVADTGKGMNTDTKAKIFEPFFTTKFAGRGLGLAAALGIVRGHKGFIKVSSAPGQGTSFRVFFPVSHASARHFPAEPTPETAWKGSGTVLLVDDEAIVRAVTREMLEHMGFEVLVAPGGAEGIELFRQNPEKITCAIIDVTMPYVSGLEVLREIRRMRPDARVILTSGYSQLESGSGADDAGADAFLQKPFTAVELAVKLRDVLEGESRLQRQAARP
ncbi:MAG: GAF domain-containing protein [Bdellovibrionota bacterium]